MGNEIKTSYEILNNFYEEKKKIWESREERKEDKTNKIEQLKNIQYQETEEEKRLFKKFEEIANSDPDEKFKFEHVERLGVDANVVVIYGKKGIGKTYQISKIIEKIAEDDPKAQIVLMRNTVAEFQALEKQMMDEISPIEMKGKSSNSPTLWHKTLRVEGKERYMGWCAALNGFSMESAKGADHKLIRLIIWDECTNLGTGNDYDASDIYRFVTFLDSVIRTKKNVKIFIFGNFHRNSDGKVSDVLLDTLRIPYGSNLKLRTVSSKDGSNKIRFLFINTGSLYKGIDANATISLFAGEIAQEDLYSNTPVSFSPMVGGLNLFYNHKPEWGYLFQEGDITYVLLVSSFKRDLNNDSEELNWMIHMEEWPSLNYFVHDLLTAEVGIYNTYTGQGICFISRQEEWLLLEDLYEMGLNESIYFSTDETRLLYLKFTARWREKYNFGIDISYFPEKRQAQQGFRIKK